MTQPPIRLFSGCTAGCTLDAAPTALFKTAIKPLHRIPALPAHFIISSQNCLFLSP